MKTRYLGPIFAALIVAAATLVAPKDADAFGRLGVDGIWVPVAWQNVDTAGRDLGATSTPGSFGVSAHGNLGFNAFSAGLKLNYFNEGRKIDDNETRKTVRRDQFDINAHLRFGIPKTKIGLAAEVGPSLSTDYEGIGFNVGTAFEYSVVKVPMVAVNLGLMGQYVNLPANINNLETDNKSIKGILYLGADFGP